MVCMIELSQTYRLLGEGVSFGWHRLPWQPPPASQPPAGGMIQPEIVGIANAGDLAEQRPASKVVGFDMIDGRDAPKIRLVKSQSQHRRHCQRDGRDQRPRL